MKSQQHPAVESRDATIVISAVGDIYMLIAFLQFEAGRQSKDSAGKWPGGEEPNLQLSVSQWTNDNKFKDKHGGCGDLGPLPGEIFELCLSCMGLAVLSTSDL
jgi:hypothetical protein